jgi:hypothetical protein
VKDLRLLFDSCKCASFRIVHNTPKSLFKACVSFGSVTFQAHRPAGKRHNQWHEGPLPTSVIS